MTFLIRTIAIAAALGISVWLMDSVRVTGSDALTQQIGETPADIVAFLVLALLLGLVNAVIKPIVELVALPVTCLTLGLFSVVINAAMVALTAWLSQFTPFVMTFETVWAALLTAIIIMVVSSVIDAIFVPRRSRSRGEE